MTRQEPLYQALCSVAKVNGVKMMRQGKLSDKQCKRVNWAWDEVKELSKHIMVYDGVATSDFLHYQTLRMLAQEDVRIPFVDFAELAADEKGGEYERVTSIYRAARELARARNIPVVYMGQLNRAVEHDPSGSGLPSLHNLKQAGDEVAATVMSLYHPYGYQEMGEKVQVSPTYGYRNIEEYDSPVVREMKEKANKSRLYLLVTKRRFAGRGLIRLNVVPEWTYISDDDPESERTEVVRLIARRYEQERTGKDAAAGDEDF